MTWNVLVISSNEVLYNHIESLLTNIISPCTVYWVHNENEAIKSIKEQLHDIYVIDHDFGDSKMVSRWEVALGTIQIYKPTIFLINKKDNENELKLIKTGTSEFLLKEKLDEHHLNICLRYTQERYNSISERFKNQQLYQNLFYDAPSPHCIVQPDFEIIKRNKAFNRLFSTQQTENINLASLIKSEDSFHALKQAFYEYGSVLDFDLFMIVGTEVINCSVNGNTSYNPNGQVESYHLVILDQTSGREKLLNDKYSMTGRIARMVAHEVRNPLTNVKLALTQIDAIAKKDSSLQVYTDIIKRNSDRINDLITSLLNASIPSEISKSKIEVKELFESALRIVKDRLVLNKIVATIEIDSDISQMTVDRSRMEIAITNLLVNAIEAINHENGKIKILVNSAEQGKHQIHIIDNGSGMSPDVRKNLFEPFYSNKKSGTGLGLSTTLNIIKAHNGKLLCDSTANQGTKFSIIF